MSKAKLKEDDKILANGSKDNKDMKKLSRHQCSRNKMGKEPMGSKMIVAKQEANVKAKQKSVKRRI